MRRAAVAGEGGGGGGGGGVRLDGMGGRWRSYDEESGGCVLHDLGPIFMASHWSGIARDLRGENTTPREPLNRCQLSEPNDGDGDAGGWYIYFSYRISKCLSVRGACAAEVGLEPCARTLPRRGFRDG